MNAITSRQAYAIAIVGGALLWLLAMAVSGRREAWDSSLYWSLAYPLSIALAGVLGYKCPERPWRWGLAVMLSQAVVLVVSAASFGLFPLGMILFGILSLPGIMLARYAARLRMRQAA